MGKHVTLTAEDGHTFSAYTAGDGPLGLIVVQEIFGVNSHIRNTVDRFAGQGFTAIAPALFDRIGPGLELGYTTDDVAEGRALRGKVNNPDALADIKAASEHLKAAGLPVGVVGYCWGGSLAWAAATGLEGIGASVGYYGGEIPKNRDAQPKCPVMLHFGEADTGIPMADVETVIKAHPEVPIHIYPAGHGFSCDERGSYDEASHKSALSRTLPFLKDNLAGG